MPPTQTTPQPDHPDDADEEERPPAHRTGRAIRWAKQHRGQLAAGGAAAAAIPGIPGLVAAAGGRPGVVLTAFATTMVTGTAAAATAMYREWQETRRKEIEWHGTNVLADAMAALIDDAHRGADGLPPDQQVSETERVRTAARQLMAQSGAPMLDHLARPHAHGDDTSPTYQPKPRASRRTRPARKISTRPRNMREE
jgi:hypothetical protein